MTVRTYMCRILIHPEGCQTYDIVKAIQVAIRNANQSHIPWNDLQLTPEFMTDFSGCHIPVQALAKSYSL